MAINCHACSNDRIISVLKSTEELNTLKDVDAILDKILLEARKIANADAGSIFLKKNDMLTFSYVHNETLFSANKTNAELYMDIQIPIDKNSIVGFVATSGQALHIEDAYKIEPTKSYQFNPSYDLKSGYHTQSIYTLPLKDFDDNVVGVMQLINARTEQGAVVPFSTEDQMLIPLFAGSASIAIERGNMNRELILRMVKMAELKDPTETGAHVQRVAGYTVEIYTQLAQTRGLDHKIIRKNKDLIRLASMLHDVGKVGITDLILKKPGKLTDDEYNIMKWHTVYGAKLFINTTSRLDQMARDIALNHHERWGGGGYPGKIEDVQSQNIQMGETKVGKEIPLEARITALADVYDALSSKRSYKDAWPEEKILSIIEKDTGTHFDPEVSAAFFKIHDVILAIREKYKDTQGLDQEELIK
ncbi:metal dependent phosphohydrolase with GAF sensor [Candidatus Magnetomorum sp. HK-1]|nr:metal dependent phosphohydrolase with GAF sensor [Candidatus Magnetomorum sp. HK-1]